MKRNIILIAMMILSVLSIEAKNEKQPSFIYGFASSFNDSTVYLVEIQMLEDTWIDSKTGFLYGRDSYSYQLRDYLKSQGVKAPTCVTGFAKTRKKAEEKYLKLRNKYLAKGKYDIKYLSTSDFKYTPVAFDESTVYVNSSKPTIKKSKK